MTDEQIALKYLTKMSDSGFAGTRRALLAHPDNPLPPGRLSTALARLEASGQVELAEVQKTSTRTDDSITAEWRAGVELAAARGDAHSRKVAATWDPKYRKAAPQAEPPKPEPIADLDPIAKAFDELSHAFAKASIEKETAMLEFQAGLQVYADLLGKPANDILATEYMCTPAGSARYAKVCKGDNAAATLVDSNPTLAALRTQLAEAMARMAARTEQYALLWNWSPVDADKRLLSISADHKADMASALSIQNTISALTASLAARQHVLATTSQTTPGTAYQTQPDLMPAPKRHVGPAMLKFNTELENFAKATKKTVEAATAAFLGTPDGNMLYAESELERLERR